MFLVFFVGVFLDFKNISKINKMACMGFLLAVVVEILGLNNDVFSRAMLMPCSFLLILVPNIMAEYRDKDLVFLGKIIIFIASIAWFVYYERGSAIIPYIPFWGK